MSKSSQIRQKVQNLLKKGQFDKAIDEYKRLVNIESRNPNLYNELGDIYLKAGNRVAAVASFEKASKNYENVALYNNAVAVCKKILRVVPQHLETIYKLGELRIKQHLEGEGINYFDQLLDLLLSDPEREIGDLPTKLQQMLELAPEEDDVASKVAMIFERMGRKVKAVEILTALCNRMKERGTLDKLEVYEGRISALRSGMTAEESSEVQHILSPEEGAAGAVAGPAVEGAAMKEPPPQREAGAQMQQPHPEQEDAGGDEGAPEEEEAAAAGAAMPAGVQVATGEGGSAAVSESDEHAEGAGAAYEADEQAAAPAEEVAVGTLDQSQTAGRDAAGRSGRKGEYARVAAGDDYEGGVTGKLADEITSDVEKDDHQGHYDLGMAYLEMALYTEAIKEFQVAARSDQLQLKSYEMIGNCFLLQNNPRLAVKQLLRGLDVARTSGGDTLGIHYNLGLAYEMLGEDDRAREHFEEVYVIDITFRDIAEKMDKYSKLS